MRKALLWLVGIAAVAVVVIAAGWTLYAPTARAQIEQAFADLNAQGVEARYADLKLEGFPFAYEAQFADLSVRSAREGVAVELPEASGWVSPLDLSAVNIALPETFTITLFNEERLAAVDVLSSGLVATLRELPDDALGYDIRAETLRVEPAGMEGGDHIDYTAPRLTGRLTRGADGVPSALDFDFVAAAFASQIALIGADGAIEDRSITGAGLAGALDATPSQVEMTMDAARIEIDGGALVGVTSFDAVDIDVDVVPIGEFDLARLAAAQGDAPSDVFARLAAILVEAVIEGGALDLNVGVERYDMSAPILEPEVGMREVGLSAIESRVQLVISGDTGELESSSGDVTFEAIPLDVQADPLSGVIGLTRMSLRYPLRAAPGVVQPARLSYEIAELDLNEATWRRLDPTNALPRSMPGLRADGELGLEVFQDLLTFDASPDGGEEPIELRTMTLETFELELLGFRADATGALEMIDEKLNGELTMTMSNWRELLAGLAQSDLFDPAQLMIAQFTLESVSEPVDETTSRMRLAFEDGAPMLNGRPAQ